MPYPSECDALLQTVEAKKCLAILWSQLADTPGLLQDAIGPYPADHGISHVSNVLRNLVALLSGSKRFAASHRLDESDTVALFAAAMVHDVGMVRLMHLGAYDRMADQRRSEHAARRVIAEIATPALTAAGFRPHEVGLILSVAAAHADDSETAAEAKIATAVRNRGARAGDICLMIRLLQLADFLDIGIDRLRRAVAHVDWGARQFVHLKRHLYLEPPRIHDGVIILTLTQEMQDQFDELKHRAWVVRWPPDVNWQEENERLLECVSTLQKTREDLQSMIAELNAAGPFEWHLRPLDEELFGRICPIGSGMALFSREFAAARREWERPGVHGAASPPMPIEWMGHSLYQRFVSDCEGLNGDLQSLVQEGRATMRVLLLDPDFEDQQACEVYESQVTAESGEDLRSILPLRDRTGSGIVRNGDILDSIQKLREDVWRPQPNRHGSLFEVRCTRRLLYASVVRFGTRMIVAPYRDGGLFNQSGALLLTHASPLFHAYRMEFASIWDHPEETRLLIHRSGDVPAVETPLRRLVPATSRSAKVPAFSYETWLLRDPERIRGWFGPGPVPPFEIEVQPASRCSFACGHCIGRNVGSLTGLACPHLKKEDAEMFRSVFAWGRKTGAPKVERIRLSGLTGDPLGWEAFPFSEELIRLTRAARRQLVVFTNGATLTEDQVRHALRSTDYVHVSLDAASAEVFATMKRVAPAVFSAVVEGTRKLRFELGNAADRPKIGFGFVVTQQNYSQVQSAVDLARECGLDFIRFRRDIHRPDAIGWREWRETRKRVLHAAETARDALEIWVTDVPRRHWTPHVGTCWAQHYCVTVGPDGWVYPCDHLTGAGRDCAFGDLHRSTLKEILGAAKPARLGKGCRHCQQCPPFNQRANRLFEEVKILHDEYGQLGGGAWDPLTRWIIPTIA